MQASSQTEKIGWHVAKWGTLGWLETAIKGIGILLAWIAFAGTLGAVGFTFRSNPHLAAVIVLIVLTLPTLLIPFVRFQQREVVSIFYALFNLTGHVALLLALLRVPGQRGLGIAFAVCYVIGELVKQRFLATTGYSEGGAKPAQMVMVSRVIMAVYIVFAVLLLF